MIVFRISSNAYSHDLSGNGAKRSGARWNSKGIPVLYTAEHISLAILEMLVHVNFKELTNALDLIYIKIPEQQDVTAITLSQLKKNWREDAGYTQYIGDEVIKQKRSLVVKVPSAVIPEEYNYLVNPLHIEFKKIKIIQVKKFWPDERLFANI